MSWYVITIKHRIGTRTFGVRHYLVSAPDGAGVEQIIQRYGLGAVSGQVVSWEPLDDLKGEAFDITGFEALS